jgi:hypothetical protein
VTFVTARFGYTSPLFTEILIKLAFPTVILHHQKQVYYEKGTFEHRNFGRGGSHHLRAYPGDAHKGTGKFNTHRSSSKEEHNI